MRNAAIRLRALQDCVQRLYRLELQYDVDDFVTSRRDFVRTLHPGSPEGCEEVVLVREDEHGNVELSVFLDAALLARLEAADPLSDLRNDNLADFCIAAEGVSHFVHLIWRAEHARQTTQFELELQAEIDKFLLAALLLREQQAMQPGPELHRKLFERIRFHDTLDAVALVRYRDANHYAGKYCRHLHQAYLTDTAAPALSPAPDMLNELYRFYRLPQPEKLRHIDSRTTPLAR